METRSAWARIPVSQAAARWSAALVGLAAFGVYVRTLAPSIVPGDGPELTTAAYYAGVPHPSGYPLYMLLGYLFTHGLPFGSVAYRMNLLSAAGAAAAVALVSLLAARVTRSALWGAATALLFAFSRTFWSQAVSAEVYTIHAAFIAAVLGAVLAWDARGDRRWLLAAALLLGFSFTHHLSTVLLLPGLLFFALTSPRRGQFLRELRWTLPLFFAPALLYVYLPLAAWRNTPANWGDPSSPANFLLHVTGRQYRDRMFHLGPAGVWRHLLDYAANRAHGEPGYLLSQFPAFLLPFGAAGLLALWRGGETANCKYQIANIKLRRSRRVLGLTVLIYGTVVFWAVNYNINDIDVYYIPAHLMLALWIGAGASWAAARLGAALREARARTQGRLARRAAPVMAAAAFAATGLWTNWHVNDLHDEWSALTYARAALDALKPNALLIADGDSWYFPIIYARFVEHRRPDVAAAAFFDVLLPGRIRRTQALTRQGVVVHIPPAYLHPQAGRNWDTSLLKWLLLDNVGRRPVYLLGEPVRLLSEPWMREVVAGYCGSVTSNVPAVEVTRTAPPLERFEAASFSGSPVRFGPRGKDGAVRPAVELLGYDVEPLARTEVPWLRVRYYWQADDPELARRVQVRAMFADGDGNYDKNEDGSVDFNNYHALGQGSGPGERDVRGRFRETFQVYVPPRAWNRRLYLWVALVVDGKFLPVEGDPARYDRVGEMPVVAMHGAQLRQGWAGVRRASR